eukprot:CAMPEP_0180691982 /NCGR_PEP_ID=MMETSP1038_2-20121128/567_1 /TAXON_ID=632150 /ORGANISM="Azadinium spinosum, Strain 3D9" /LENGTH=69 /DNA_ID=CAMNT_0022723093 /DNA_START=99 /DNA_END=305 /DNA_ORIENTATION=+
MKSSLLFDRAWIPWRRALETATSTASVLVSAPLSMAALSPRRNASEGVATSSTKSMAQTKRPPPTIESE